MSEDRVTIDKIIKMFWDVAGFRADATQTDALQVLLETYAAQQAIAYQDASPELTQALLNSLAHLASQILDTGGRMRLSPDGQLDARDQPIALAADVRIVDKRLGQLHGAVSELTQAMLAMSEQLTDNEKKHARRQESLETVLDIVGQDLRNDREAQRAVGDEIARMRDVMEAFNVSAQTLTKTVLEAVASRGQVEELADQVRRLRGVIDYAMESPRQQPFLDTTAAELGQQVAQATEDALAKALSDPDMLDWERRIVEQELAVRLTQPEVLPTAEDAPGQTWSAMTGNLTTQEIASLQEDMAAGKLPVRRIKVNASRAAEPVRYENGHPVFPGCFFNDDGTITCRDCGVAKMPSEDKKVSEYYKDRQSHTGYKASCKDCEKAAKAAAKVA